MSVELRKAQTRKEILSKFGYITKLVVRSFFIATFILLSVVLFIMVVSFGDSVYNMKNGIKKNPLFGVYVIVTESMIPTINVSDAIVVKRVDDESLEIGDIITFSSSDIHYNGLTVTHRVVGKQVSSTGEYIYRTKGDNNYFEDTALVNMDSIYGKVLLKIPKLGKLKKFVSSPVGFIISVLTPVLLVIIYEVYRILNALKRQDENVEII